MKYTINPKTGNLVPHPAKCKKGHPLNENNLGFQHKADHWACKECHRIVTRNWQSRNVESEIARHKKQRAVDSRRQLEARRANRLSDEDVKRIGKSIGSRIKELRKDKKLSLLKAATLAGVVPATWKGAEQGVDFRVILLFKIAKALKCSVFDLLADHDNG